MKKTLLVFCIALTFLSCGDSTQTKAIKDQNEAQAIIKSMQPGRIATKEGEWTMTMKLNGKDWVASSMVQPDANDMIIGYKGEESVRLPYYKNDMKVGSKVKFGEYHAADLFTDDEVGIWGGRKGEMEITKVENGWAEGKFFFTATAGGTDKQMEVTDGFFRIAIAK